MPILLTFLFFFFVSVSTLKTNGRYIVTEQGNRVKLACVNWSGAAQKDGIVGGLKHNTIDNISAQIKDWKFNCVRIPFSVSMVLDNFTVNDTTIIESNPELLNVHVLNVMDKVISSLQKNNLFVILDNHMSDADWCCSLDDQNGLWYNDRFPESSWLEAHRVMAQRYASYDNVIGSELRNELRGSYVSGVLKSPTWGSNDEATDWRLAAIKAGNMILAINPGWLIFVDGLEYSTNLRDVYNHPISFNIVNRLVYSAHNYEWSQDSLTANNYDLLHALLGNSWGYLIEEGKAYTAPVWVSEIGISHSGDPQKNSVYFSNLMKYLSFGGDFDFAYWRLDGTESHGTGRTFDAEESFGIYNIYWNDTSNPLLLSSLQSLIPSRITTN